ncbi:N-acetyltransferase [Capnocytophaga sp. HP1101]
MTIRPITPAEYRFLDDFLYDAIFIPEGVTPPDRSITQHPELQKYTAHFGTQKDDFCLVAEVDSTLVGAVWVRIIDDYGHVDDDTPSLSISVKAPYRQKGIGTALMQAMLSLLKSKGYKQVSLSVQKANYACKMYLQLGFEIIKTNEEDFIMVCKL